LQSLPSGFFLLPGCGKTLKKKGGAEDQNDDAHPENEKPGLRRPRGAQFQLNTLKGDVKAKETPDQGLDSVRFLHRFPSGADHQFPGF
jgi:hypothetical protein